MRIAWIVLILFVVGCTPQKRLQRIVKNHPELVTTETVIERDTVRIPEIKEVTRLEVVRDTIAIDGLFTALERLSIETHTSTHPEVVNRLQATIEGLKRQILLEASPDTTYVIPIQRHVLLPDSSFILKGTIEIQLSDGQLLHAQQLPAISIPYERRTVIQRVDADAGVPWWAYVVMVLIAIVAYRVGKW